MEIFDLEMLHLLLFSIPGYFLITSAGIRVESEFGYFVRSFVWGLIFVAVIFFIAEKTPLSLGDEILENPYSSMLVFSVLAFLVGKGFLYFRMKFR